MNILKRLSLTVLTLLAVGTCFFIPYRVGCVIDVRFNMQTPNSFFLWFTGTVTTLVILLTIYVLFKWLRWVVTGKTINE